MKEKEKYLEILEGDLDGFGERDTFHSWYIDRQNVRVHLHVIWGPPVNSKKINWVKKST